MKWRFLGDSAGSSARWTLEMLFSCVENGAVCRRPTLSMIRKIAEALHVPVGAFFVMATEEKEFGNIDSRLAGRL